MVKRYVVGVLVALLTLTLTLGAVAHEGHEHAKPADHPDRDQGVRDPDLEYRLVAEGEGVKVETAKRVMQNQVKQVRALEKLNELGVKHVYSRFGDDFAKNGDRLEVLVEPGEHGRAVAQAAKVGFLPNKFEVLPAPEGIDPPSTGVVIQEDPCTSSGWAEGGRAAGVRNWTSKPIHTHAPATGCLGGGYSKCATSWAYTYSHHSAKDGIMTAGHCNDWQTHGHMSISWAREGYPGFSAMSHLELERTQTSLIDKYWHDVALYDEIYPTTTVRAKIYLHDDIWRNTVRYAPAAAYTQNLALCGKYMGLAIDHNGWNHENGVKCGKIMDPTEGGSNHADSHFFGYDLYFAGPAQGGSSGGPVYVYLGNGDVEALGVHSGHLGNNPERNFAYKVFRAFDKWDDLVLLTS